MDVSTLFYARLEVVSWSLSLLHCSTSREGTGRASEYRVQESTAEYVLPATTQITGGSSYVLYSTLRATEVRRLHYGRCVV